MKLVKCPQCEKLMAAFAAACPRCKRVMQKTLLRLVELPTLAEVEADLYRAMFELLKGDVQAMADALGVGKTTAYRKVNALGLR